MTQTVFETIAIIGGGLIGSSIARAVKHRGVAKNILVHDADPSVRACLDRLAIAEVCDTLNGAVGHADLVMICVPPAQIIPVAQTCLAAMKPGAILSDTGSVKTPISRELAMIMPETIALVPGHPIAGTEHSGPEAGYAELFAQRWCILTPCQPQTPDYEQAIATISRFWEQIGARVQLMDAQKHDRVLALTSHVPHLIAYGIVATALSAEDAETTDQIIRFSGGGFRDFTRIAASDPGMWRDVFLQNPKHVLSVLDQFGEHLQVLRDAIEAGEAETLFDLFARTRLIRERIIGEGEDTSQPDFGR